MEGFEGSAAISGAGAAARITALTRILQVPYTFAPDPCGGTEVYVEALTKNLRALGHAAAVAAPGERNETYEVRGVPVSRFRGAVAKLPLRDLYGAGDPVAAASFETLLDREQPEIVHLHAFTPGISIRLVRSVRRRNVPIVFTYHTPTVSCQRGTLMKWGIQSCNGKIEVRDCTSCSLHGLGLYRPMAKLLGGLSTAIGGVLEAVGLQGGMWTALRMTDLVEHRQAAFCELLRSVEHIVVPSIWVREVLGKNGADLRKVTVLGQGIASLAKATDQSCASAEFAQPDLVEGKLRFACLARLHPTKGLHVITEALRLIPEVDISVDVFGIMQGASDREYLRYLMRRAASDHRLRFQVSLARDEILQLLNRYDAVLVPSICLETGPLVVLEAFAAGIPVVGSRLGGIAERVRDGVDGVLVEPGSVVAWAGAIRQLVQERAALLKFREAVRPPRTMEDVAEDMLGIYTRALSCSYIR